MFCPPQFLHFTSNVNWYFVEKVNLVLISSIIFSFLQFLTLPTYLRWHYYVWCQHGYFHYFCFQWKHHWGRNPLELIMESVASPLSSTCARLCRLGVLRHRSRVILSQIGKKSCEIFLVFEWKFWKSLFNTESKDRDE